MRIRMANNKKYGSDLYTDDQVRRVLEGSGIDIEKELDTKLGRSAPVLCRRGQ
jgi:hypothetical protein